MKIGFISRAFPTRPETSSHGTYKRMGMFIQALAELGELDMLFYVHPDLPVNPRFTGDMENRLARHWNAGIHLHLCNLANPKTAASRWDTYISPALRMSDHPPYDQVAYEEQIGAVRHLLAGEPDILFVHRLSSMIPLLLARSETPKVYFDMDDIEHVAFARSIRQPPRWPGKSLHYLRLPILRLWERRAIRLSQTTFICSEVDRRYLKKTYGLENVEVIPNAVDIPKEQEALPDRPAILFLGFFNYGPNIAAADYLIGAIWPLVRSAVPNARLFLAGAHPDRISAFKNHPPEVEFLGFVDDLAELYNRVSVVCCPILSGGGTRIKILEAAAYGKAIVSTTVGAEGIDLKDGREILLRDDPPSFAEACVRLLRNQDAALKIGRAARGAIIKSYRRDEVVNRIRKIISIETMEVKKQAAQ